MATSGLVNITTIDVIGIIEKAIRKCGKNPSMVESELLLEAQSELWIMLSGLVNDGVPLWTVDKQIYGVHLNQNLLQFISGTIDVRNMLYRTNVLPSGGIASSNAGGDADNAFDQDLSTTCTQTSINGSIQYDFGSPVVITTVGILPRSTSVLSPVYEYSADGVTWFQAAPNSSAAALLELADGSGTLELVDGSGSLELAEGADDSGSASETFTAGTWYWLDIQNLSSANSARYFRVRETGGGTLDMTEVVFGQAPYALPMARINQDDYQNLPNKVGNPGRPLQYWFDKQINPRCWLWPASGYEFNSIEVWRRRMIQDVGAFTDNLELPSRWLDAIIWELGFRLSMMPGFTVDANRMALLKTMSDTKGTSSWQEERDPSPVYYVAGIRGYTR